MSLTSKPLNNSSKNRFSFSFVEKNEIRKEIDWRQVIETAQYTATKITKENQKSSNENHRPGIFYWMFHKNLLNVNWMSEYCFFCLKIPMRI